MTKTEIIKETAAYYNLGNRGTRNTEHSQNVCMYLTEDGKKCAVGRVMLDDCGLFHVRGAVDSLVQSAAELNKLPFDTVAQRTAALDSILKEPYRGHDIGFWSQLQSLHDNDVNWNETGISERGQEYVDSMIERWERRDLA